MTHIGDYRLRGQRVVSLSARQIEAAALASISWLKIDKSTSRSMGQFIEQLGARFGIEIDVIGDSEWMHVTRATCDPSILAIAMPNKLYLEIIEAKPEALFIFFHELGHLLLGHKAVLHFAEDKPVSQQEDSEWQADTFSENVLRVMMGLKSDPKQLHLWPE